MIITLPSIITQSIQTIETIRIEFVTDGQTRRTANLPRNAVHHPNQNFLLSVDDQSYNEADVIRILVSTTNNNHWGINYDSVTKLQLIPTLSAAPANTITNVRYNHDTIYSNTSADKLLIGDMLAQLHQQALKVDNAMIGSSNLIYYVVGHNDAYIRLLQKSIESVQKFATCAYDIVVITDQQTQSKLMSNGAVSAAVTDYMIVDTIRDGIHSSMLKTLIFQYEAIDKYNKVLFLDCDVICKRDIAHVFDKDIAPGILYVVSNPAINTGSFKTLFHGLLAYDAVQLQQMLNAGQLPFNAGQFMFVNSARMAAFFENVNWLVDVWPGQYFFEQSFMNHYFCLNQIADPIALSTAFDLLTCNEDITRVQPSHRDQTSFIHFVAPALNGDVKLAFIDAYTYANKL